MLSKRKIFNAILPEQKIVDHLDALRLGYLAKRRARVSVAKKYSPNDQFDRKENYRSITRVRGKLQEDAIKNRREESPHPFNREGKFLFKASEWKSVPRFFPGSPPEVAIIGRSNVGKSTLLNALLSLEESPLIKALVSEKPGETRHLQFYGVGRNEAPKSEVPGEVALAGPAIVFTDMPGFGFAYMNQDDLLRCQEISKNYLTRRGNSLKRVLLLLDARHGLKIGDEAFFRDLFATTTSSLAGTPKERSQQHIFPGDRGSEVKWKLQIVLTKCDLVERLELARRIQVLKQKVREILPRIGYTSLPILAISSLENRGIIELKKELASLIVRNSPVNSTESPSNNSSSNTVGKEMEPRSEFENKVDKLFINQERHQERQEKKLEHRVAKATRRWMPVGKIEASEDLDRSFMVKGGTVDDALALKDATRHKQPVGSGSWVSTRNQEEDGKEGGKRKPKGVLSDITEVERKDTTIGQFSPTNTTKSTSYYGQSQRDLDDAVFAAAFASPPTPSSPSFSSSPSSHSSSSSFLSSTFHSASSFTSSNSSPSVSSARSASQMSVADAFAFESDEFILDHDETDASVTNMRRIQEKIEKISTGSGEKVVRTVGQMRDIRSLLTASGPGKKFDINASSASGSSGQSGLSNQTKLNLINSGAVQSFASSPLAEDTPSYRSSNAPKAKATPMYPSWSPPVGPDGPSFPNWKPPKDPNYETEKVILTPEQLDDKDSSRHMMSKGKGAWVSYRTPEAPIPAVIPAIGKNPEGKKMWLKSGIGSGALAKQFEERKKLLPLDDMTMQEKKKFTEHSTASLKKLRKVSPQREERRERRDVQFGRKEAADGGDYSEMMMDDERFVADAMGEKKNKSPTRETGHRRPDLEEERKEEKSKKSFGRKEDKGPNRDMKKKEIKYANSFHGHDKPVYTNEFSKTSNFSMDYKKAKKSVVPAVHYKDDMSYNDKNEKKVNTDRPKTKYGKIVGSKADAKRAHSGAAAEARGDRGEYRADRDRRDSRDSRESKDSRGSGDSGEREASPSRSRSDSAPTASQSSQSSQPEEKKVYPPSTGRTKGIPARKSPFTKTPLKSRSR